MNGSAHHNSEMPATNLDHARLHSGARKLGLSLSADTLAAFDQYATLLHSANERMNLVSKKSLVEMETRHILDSLTVMLALQNIPSGSIIDVGTGAGFPGLPLKIVHPHIDLTLVEATRKKVGFLNLVIEALGLERVDAVAERAETLAHDPMYREVFDVVLARALAPVAVLAELALPLCRQHGVVIAYKSPGVESEIEEGEQAVEMMGGSPVQITQVPASITGDPRVLLVIKKLSHTPPKYPRRPGLPAKHPLVVS